MRFGVLGPITAWTDAGDAVPISGVKVRAVLADLALHVGEPVTADRLIDDLWGESPEGRNPAGTLSSKVSQLRRALEAAEPGARALVRSPPPGYELAVDPAAIDAVEFAALVEAAQGAADPVVVVDTLTRALALWRGPAYSEFADAGFARAAVARLGELRLTAHEMLARARLDLGDHALVADELTELVEAHPWREGLRLSHVLALHRSGRQADALDSFERYRRALAEELGLDPSPEALALQHAVLVQDPSLAGPAPVRQRRASNLPAPRTALIGREADLDALAGVLAAERLVTLTGPGGVGKTSLALAAARRGADGFPDGTWLVELAGIERGGARDSPDALAEVVMATLAIRQATDLQARAGPVDRLAEALRDHRALVVLDNCEQIIDTVAQLVDDLLRTAPDVTVLATSRERLGVDGEVARTVRPLVTPDQQHQGDVEAVARASAVRLLVERARAAGADVTVDAESAPLVAALCRRLDGLPLALELAATLVPSLGLADVLARLSDRVWLLGGRRRGGPLRHRTLGAVIGWSWDLLDDDERCVLRRLAVHADGCGLDAAEAVCSGPDLPARAVAGVVARLVDRSLVVAVHGPAGPRYHLLESVAAYAADRLAEAGEMAAVRRRHLAFHLGHAERAEAHLYGDDQVAWLDRLDAESANLRVALDTAVGEGGAEDARRLAAALGWYWLLRGRLGEARRSLDRALAGDDAAGRAGSPAAARALVWRAVVASVQGDPVAVSHRRAALDALGELDDPVAAARAMALLGYTSLDASDIEGVEALLAVARRRSEEAGDRWGQAVALLGLSWLAHSRSDVAGLAGVSARAGELFGQVGDGWGRVVAATWQAAAAELAGDLGDAARLVEESQHDAERLGLWSEVASGLAWSGWIAFERDDPERAAAFATQAMRLAVEQGVRATQIQAAMVLAFAARRVGDLDTAETRLRELVASAEADRGDAAAIYLTTVLSELGRVAVVRGDAAGALDLHAKALDLALAGGYPRDAAFALGGGAAAAGLHGRWEDAARLLGAVDRQLGVAQLPPSPAEQREIEQITARCVDALGPASFDRLVDEGRKIPAADARGLLAPAAGVRTAGRPGHRRAS
ncbi:MAG TPA: BTAD domain-containing putative transcriptional regulator [Acidimicrobiales bacterium]